MKVVCTQENLLRGIQFVSHIAGKNVSLPILNNILVSAGSAGLDLTATNLEIGVRARVRAKVEDEGDFTVNAKLISDYVNLLSKGDNVVLETTDSELRVSCGSQQSHIKGTSAEDFPLLPNIEETDVKNYTLPIQDLRETIQKTLFSVSINDARPEISGVLFRVQGETLTVVGTDSYRLSERTSALTTTTGDANVIVPGKTWAELGRLLSMDLEEEVKISVSSTQISMEIGDVFLISRLVEGQYPDYKQIIPNTKNARVTVSRNELIQAVKAASLFSKSGINDVVVASVDNNLRVSSSNAQIGENVIDVASAREGDDVSITFNHRYLLDGLSVLEGDKVHLDLIGKNSPGVLRSEDAANFLYIIMPIKQ